MNEIKRPNLLVFIRHAESERNKLKQGSVYFADEEARKTVRGVPDHKIGITERGRNQALLTGAFLRKEFGVPDYIYHSGYLRTVQTLDAIMTSYLPEEKAQINVRSNHFIRERDPGYAYDMTKEEAEKNFPYLNEYWKTFGGFFSRPPGGQSLSDKADECYLFLNMLFRDRAGKKIFVVTHGGTLRCFRYLLERWDYERATSWPKGQSPKNCGLTVYRFDPAKGHLALEEYNTIAYDEGVEPPHIE